MHPLVLSNPMDRMVAVALRFNVKIDICTTTCDSFTTLVAGIKITREYKITFGPYESVIYHCKNHGFMNSLCCDHAIKHHGPISFLESYYGFIVKKSPTIDQSMELHPPKKSLEFSMDDVGVMEDGVIRCMDGEVRYHTGAINRMVKNFGRKINIGRQIVQIYINTFYGLHVKDVNNNDLIALQRVALAFGDEKIVRQCSKYYKRRIDKDTGQ